MSIFSGKMEVKMDAKNRFFIPAQFRRLLTEQQVQTVYLRQEPGLDCLTVYPEKVWQERLESYRGVLNDMKSADMGLLIQLSGEAVEMNLDSQGRILLSKSMLQAIRSTGQELLIIGVIDRFTIWDKKDYESFRLNPTELSQSIEQRL